MAIHVFWYAASIWSAVLVAVILHYLPFLTLNPKRRASQIWDQMMEKHAYSGAASGHSDPKRAATQLQHLCSDPEYAQGRENGVQAVAATIRRALRDTVSILLISFILASVLAVLFRSYQIQLSILSLKTILSFAAVLLLGFSIVHKGRGLEIEAAVKHYAHYIGGFTSVERETRKPEGIFATMRKLTFNNTIDSIRVLLMIAAIIIL